ncbi:hypothetical protein Agub_g4017, partial [Astrephomene gubernaculifera]
EIRRRSSSGGLRRSGGGGGGGLLRSAAKQYLLRRAPELLVLHLKRFAMDGRGRARKIDKHVAFDTTLDLAPFLSHAATAYGGTAGGAGGAGGSSATGAVPAADAAAATARAVATSGESTGGMTSPFIGTLYGALANGGAANGSGCGNGCNGSEGGMQPAAAPPPASRSALAAAVAEQRSGVVQPPCVYDLLGLVEHSGELRYGHYVAYVKRANPAAGGAPQWYYASDSQVRPVAEAQVLRAQAYILLYERRE